MPSKVAPPDTFAYQRGASRRTNFFHPLEIYISPRQCPLEFATTSTSKPYQLPFTPTFSSSLPEYYCCFGLSSSYLLLCLLKKAYQRVCLGWKSRFFSSKWKYPRWRHAEFLSPVFREHSSRVKASLQVYRSYFPHS